MTDRKQALTDLLAKIEAGEFDARTYPLMKLPQMSMNTFDNIHAAYNGSLDAAKALHEAVLPNESWMVRWVSKYPNLFGSCGGSHQAKVGWGEEHIAYSDNPARAWLIAIIKALISEETQ